MTKAVTEGVQFRLEQSPSRADKNKAAMRTETAVSDREWWRDQFAHKSHTCLPATLKHTLLIYLFF